MLTPVPPTHPAVVMVRSLLAERFGLVVHREIRELPSFTLTMRRSDRRLGPQLTPSDTDCEVVRAARQSAQGATIIPPPPGQPRQCGATGAVSGSVVTLRADSFSNSQLAGMIIGYLLGVGPLSQRELVRHRRFSAVNDEDLSRATLRVELEAEVFL